MGNNEEIWVDIPNYEGFYQCSNNGRVRSLDRVVHYKSGISVKYNGIILKLRKHSAGYSTVLLSKNNTKQDMFVHRIVALLFIPNPLNLPEVNHKNGIKSDSRASELEWVTASENQLHSYNVLKRKSSMAGVTGKNHPHSKRVSCDTLGISFDSATDAANTLGLNIGNICGICTGNSGRIQTQGLTFRYI